MNDAARLARYQIEAMGGLDYADIEIVNRFLRRTPNNVGGELVTPLELVARQVAAR